MQARGNDQFLTVGYESPDQSVLAEIGGDSHSEHPPLASGEKVRRLASIRTAPVDSIVGANRHIQLLLRIPIEVAEKQAESAVRILEPTFEGAGDAGAGFMRAGSSGSACAAGQNARRQPDPRDSQ